MPLLTQRPYIGAKRSGYNHRTTGHGVCVAFLPAPVYVRNYRKVGRSDKLDYTVPAVLNMATIFESLAHAIVSSGPQVSNLRDSVSQVFNTFVPEAGTAKGAEPFFTRRNSPGPVDPRGTDGTGTAVSGPPPQRLNPTDDQTRISGSQGTLNTARLPSKSLRQSQFVGCNRFEEENVPSDNAP
jgi:hypothetical protein